VDRLFGGPEWAKWDGFDIQALIPEGTPAYTSRQFFDRQAPELQQMLQALLEDQFGLTLRHETREMSVYLLTRGKDGPKLRDSSSERDPFLARWKEGDKICCESSGPEGFQVFKRPIADMARIVSTALDVPVLDRTGLAGEFNYRLGFAYQERRGLPPAPPPGSRREPGAGPPDSRSLFAALEQDLGLKLEPARLPMEVLVIERAEKPSEN
jgi:uncharacterized protein (TIGR03435 family)